MTIGALQHRAIAAFAGLEPFLNPGDGPHAHPGPPAYLPVRHAPVQKPRDLEALAELDYLAFGQEVAKESARFVKVLDAQNYPEQFVRILVDPLFPFLSHFFRSVFSPSPFRSQPPFSALYHSIAHGTHPSTPAPRGTRSSDPEHRRHSGEPRFTGQAHRSP